MVTHSFSPPLLCFATIKINSFTVSMQPTDIPKQHKPLRNNPAP